MVRDRKNMPGREEHEPVQRRLRTVRQLPRWQAAVLLSSIALLAAACSSAHGSTGSSASASASSPALPTATSAATPQASGKLCQDLASLRTSLNQLAHLNPATTTTTQISNDLSNFKGELTALRKDAAGRYSTEINAMQSEWSTMQAAVKELRSHPVSPSAESRAATAFRNFETTGNHLLAKTKSVCPSATAKPSG